MIVTHVTVTYGGYFLASSLILVDDCMQIILYAYPSTRMHAHQLTTCRQRNICMYS